MKKVRLALVGAGDRGTSYVDFGAESCPEMEVVAVADPDPVRVRYIKEKFGLSDDVCFERGEDLLALPKLADAAIIATQDKQHYDLAMTAIEKGYHLLLEKPVAPTAEECLAISEAANAKGVRVIVCHVLRFTPFFRLLKDTIDSGKIGKIINMIHLEGVGNVHQSHSYVRGNWRNTAESSPMILAKSCHDIDILQWLIGEECTKVQSFGSLTYFRRENMPEGAPEYCYQGCPAEADCPYSALKIYKDRTFPSFVKRATKTHVPTDEEIWKAITESNYGRCVFRSDNDVVDHQVVNLEYKSGATVSFTMSAFNKGGRKLRIMGTKGEITAEMSSDHITVFDFNTRKYEDIYINNPHLDQEISGGHGGGDRGIICSFCQLLAGTYTGNSITDITTSVDNHLTTFAAEESRLTDKVIYMDEYKAQIKKL